MNTGIFVGLTTLDCIYQTHKALAPNEKQVADAMLLAAGGPAANAAIAFQALGGHAILVTALGHHPLTTVIREDLSQQGIELLDMTPNAEMPPPFSSIVVNVKTGDRAVISRNAADRPRIETQPPNTVLSQADCLLIDGHQMWLGQRLAQQAARRNLPVVIDAGSWKPGFETVLSQATHVIASANFRPPDSGNRWEAIAYLRSLNVPHCAVTQGEQSILYQTPTQSGELPVPHIQPVDTLGAGDIFHGAFCHHLLQTPDFLAALSASSKIAALACQSFGTRQWMQHLF